jgi:hypothetical protein
MPRIDVEFLWYCMCRRLNLDPDRYDLRNDDGMTTTEVAVITFLLVAAAIVVLAVIYNAAKSNVDNIPVPETPGG